MLHQAAPEARPQLAADVVDAPTAAPHAPEEAGANGAAGSPMIYQPQADGFRAFDPQAQLAPRRAAESPAAALRRAKFERLTAGMLDQVETASPGPNGTSGAAR
jgi:hypothetical protein